MAETPPGPGPKMERVPAAGGRSSARPATTGMTDPKTATYPKGVNETVGGGKSSGRHPGDKKAHMSAQMNTKTASKSQPGFSEGGRKGAEW